jgi:acetylornithine/N-succinyldiaminopimelate aminotransferase
VRHGFGAVRGQGLLLALDLCRDIGPKLVERAWAEGLLINAPKADCLRFMPALNVTAAEIGEMIRILDRVCGVVAKR